MTEIPLIALLHFVVGAITVIAGAAALILRKGSRPHRAAGHLFFVSMLLLCASGIYLSVTRAILFTFFLAVFAAYLVTTGWVSARRRDGAIGGFEKLAFYVVLLSAISLVGIGVAERALGISTGGDVPAGAYFFLAGLAGFFSVLDFRVVKSGRLSGKHKIARHLWRMCFSMLIASAIFFLGNNHVLPEMLRHPYILNGPIIAVLAAMLFWLGRIWLARAKS